MSEISGKFERRPVRLSWTVLQYRPAPRTLLFFFALIVELVASAISAVGFVLNNSVFFLGGTLAWLAWFVVIFLVASPKTDHLLRNYSAWTYFFYVGIIVLASVMFNWNTPEPASHQLTPE
jgi:hypothetical protein